MMNSTIGQWFVCVGSKVFSGLFPTKKEAMAAANGVLNDGWTSVSLHQVGVKPVEWMPIETAPRDENILLWNGDDVIQGRYLGTYCMETSFEGSTMVCVTHWMPLPEPPKS